MVVKEIDWPAFFGERFDAVAGDNPARSIPEFERCFDIRSGTDLPSSYFVVRSERFN